MVSYQKYLVDEHRSSATTTLPISSTSSMSAELSIMLPVINILGPSASSISLVFTSSMSCFNNSLALSLGMSIEAIAIFKNSAPVTGGTSLFLSSFSCLSSRLVSSYNSMDLFKDSSVILFPLRFSISFLKASSSHR